eukprot:g5999.t1
MESAATRARSCTQKKWLLEPGSKPIRVIERLTYQTTDRDQSIDRPRNQATIRQTDSAASRTTPPSPRKRSGRPTDQPTDPSASYNDKPSI